MKLVIHFTHLYYARQSCLALQIVKKGNTLNKYSSANYFKQLKDKYIQFTGKKA